MIGVVRIHSKLLLLGLGFVALWGLYVFAIPEVQLADFRRRFPDRKILPEELSMSFQVRSLLRTCEVFAYAWVFYFGASIGSFLNVVAGRVPVGKSIIVGGSKCPYCNTSLGFLDNTPIFGWLLLNGRCRTCKLPIAKRYIGIELLLGTLFFSVAAWQLTSGGWNLPGADLTSRSGFTLVLFNPKWSLIVITLVHASMFSVLVMLGFASTLRRDFPVGASVVMIAILSIPRFVLPTADYVKWTEPFIAGGLKELGTVANSSVSVLFGIVAGLTLGIISSRSVLKFEKNVVRYHWVLQSIVIGAILGWQAVFVVVSAGSVLLTLSRLFLSRDKDYLLAPPWTSNVGVLVPNVCLLGICILHHAFWRQIAHCFAILNHSLVR